MQPAWSPDGRHIDFIGAPEEGDAEPRLWVVNLGSGEVRQLGHTDAGETSVDIADPESVHWTRDAQRIVLTRA